MKKQNFLHFAIFKKNLFFILSGLVCTSINSYAQQGFSFGIKAGTGFSQYYFVNYVEQDFVQVYQGGLVVSHLNDKNLGLHFEILQSQKAWQEKFSETYKKRVIIDYLEFPVISVIKVGKKSGLTINAGLHFSFPLKIDSMETGEPSPADTSRLINYSGIDVSGFDYGLNGGLGYQFCFGRNIIELQVMYSQGLQNIFERNYLSLYRSLNQNLYVNLIYKISLAKKRQKQSAKSP
jgi:hypothetical protein